ncbi:MAG: GNAT family N-acetyltransferase, partial [Clostridium sp.]
MNFSLEKLNDDHGKKVMEIFNYYIENSTAAFPNIKLPETFYEKFKEKINGYPAYAVKNDDEVIGFCFLSPYNFFSTFKNTAAITYFISKDYTGQGIGKLCLDKLEDEGRKIGIKNIVAEISSKNEASLKFHKKNGFEECGNLKDIGNKFGEDFGVIYMKK